MGNNELPERNHPHSRVHFIKGPFFDQFTVNSLGIQRLRLHLPCYSRATFRVPMWDFPQKKSLARAVRNSFARRRISTGVPCS
jgi:hypothetical protein